MNKKIFIVALLFCIILFGCSNNEPKDEKNLGLNPGLFNNSNILNKDFSSTVINGEYARAKVNFNVNYANFLKDNTVYNNDIALFGAVMCNDLGNEWSTKLDGVTYNEENQEEALYEELGFEEISIIDLKDNEYEIDEYDTTKFVLGHYAFKNGDDKYNVVLINVCMTDGKNEWLSNLDIGADAENYKKYYGENHPDWKNKDNHKGFDVAANRVAVYVEEYLAELDPESNTILFVTGYSRGAAIANILAANYTKLDKYKVFGYTYETPNTVCTEEDTTANYKNIFNICTSSDVVTKVPLSSWGFKRYGIDIIKDVNQTTYKNLTGSDFYQTNENSFPNINLLNCTREEIYDKEFVVYNNLDVSNGNLDMCNTLYETCKNSINNLSKKEMFKISEIECIDGKYNFTITGSLSCFIEVVAYFIPNFDDLNTSTLVAILNYINILNYYLPVVGDIINIVGFSFDTIKLTNPHYLLATISIIQDYK